MSVNSSASDQYQSALERSLMVFMISLPCLVFLSVNLVMLWTLRSKPLFRDTCRYVLLYNLLLADTLQMSLSQLLFLFANVRLLLSFPLCGLLVMLAHLTNDISPLTLIVMSLERYVAVCLPLRHSSIATTRNTAAAVLGVWTFSLAVLLVRLGLLLQFPFHTLDSLQMKDTCYSLVLYLGPHSKAFDEILTYFLFASALLSIAGSYVAVMLVARSATVSADRSSAHRARNTLLLHLVQLGFMVTSTFFGVLQNALYAWFPRLVFIRMLNTLFVFLIILPKCLSTLIYGLRDPAIRTLLLYHLCCRLTDRKTHVLR